MRYFRYDRLAADVSNLKQHYAGLSAKEQARRRRFLWLHRLGTVVFWLLFLASFIGFVLLIRKIEPVSDSVLDAILHTILFVCLGFFALIFSAILGALAAAPLWGRNQAIEKDLRQVLLRQATQELRQFYGFQEPFLVTKCYRASDRRFDRHDVCLFLVDGKLRLTVNLHYGFFDPRRDFGCYEFDFSEIELLPGRHKDREAVELRFAEITFLLGQQARSFIENTAH
ncbi:MAG: hypothetical protein II359_05260 [Clostridia bacterium]|nr:hypothetical protein [Clostridia bacterium]